MKEPTLDQRATFLAMFLGMAKDYGYTQAMLLRDVRACWHAAQTAEQARATSTVSDVKS